MLYRISVTERGLTGIANIFRSRLSRLDDLLGAGTVPLILTVQRKFNVSTAIHAVLYIFGMRLKTYHLGFGDKDKSTYPASRISYSLSLSSQWHK